MSGLVAVNSKLSWRRNMICRSEGIIDGRRGGGLLRGMEKEGSRPEV